MLQEFVIFKGKKTNKGRIWKEYEGYASKLEAQIHYTVQFNAWMDKDVMAL